MAQNDEDQIHYLEMCKTFKITKGQIAQKKKKNS